MWRRIVILGIYTCYRLMTTYHVIEYISVSASFSSVRILI